MPKHSPMFLLARLLFCIEGVMSGSAQQESAGKTGDLYMVKIQGAKDVIPPPDYREAIGELCIHLIPSGGAMAGFQEESGYTVEFLVDAFE